jgi:uncharacterized protein
MNNFLKKFLRWITNHSFFVIAVIVIISGFFATQLHNLHVEIDPDALLPQNHPLVVLGNKITQTFGGKYVVMLSMEVKKGDIFNSATLAKVQRITEKIREIPGVIPNNIQSLSSLNVKDIKGTPEGMEITRMMSSVPGTPAEMEALKERVDRNDLIIGLLVSKDRKMVNIVSDYATVHKIGGFTGLHERLKKIIEPEQDANTVFHLAGIPITTSWLGTYSSRIAWVFPLAVLMIGLLHFSAFRTIQGLVIPIVTSLLSVIWAMGIMGLCHVPLDPYNLMTPILILAVAAGHSVQILKRYYEEYHQLHNNQEAVIQSTSKVGVAMLTAGFVAAAGFASLVTFQSASIRNFGLLTASGILAALIIEMTFIPAMRTLLKAPNEKQYLQERKEKFFDPFLEKIGVWIIGGKGNLILAVALLILLLALGGIALLKTDNSPSAFFAKNSVVIHDLQATNQKMSGAYNMQVMVQGPAVDTLKDPQALRDMEKLQKFIDRQPYVGKTISLVDMIKKMNKAMHNDDSRLEVLPGSKDLIAQYLLLYSMSGDPGDFDRMVDFNYQRAVITMFVTTDSYAVLKELKTKIDNYTKTSLRQSRLRFLVGGGMASSLMANTEVIIHGKTQNILQIVGIIFLVASFVFMSFGGGLLVILPLVLSVLANLGIMGLTRISLSIPTATISAMALGVGADYAIYYLFRFREEFAKSGDWQKAVSATEATSGKAILYVASAITMGYICLSLTGFMIHIYLGILVPLTMIVSSIGALTLIPTLLLKFKPKFITKFQLNEGGVSREI